MFHVIICGTGPVGATQPFFATASTSTHDRINSSTTGIRADFVCTIFVRTRGGGATAYQMNTRNSTDIRLTAAPPALVLVEDTTRGDYNGGACLAGLSVRHDATVSPPERGCR